MLASRKVDKGFLLIAPFRYVLEMLGTKRFNYGAGEEKEMITLS
jgi:hypothetical protein